ncbi:hypothetical protein QBC39DRAFT_383061 [Podospora conica]|nr:hypothetical protein QBC39DRAFT_383061 [Schizothecium conicum]
MSSIGSRININDVIEDRIAAIPLLSFQDDNLELWGSEVLEALDTVGLRPPLIQESREAGIQHVTDPVKMLLWCLDEYPISLVDSRFGAPIRSFLSPEIIGALITRHIIRSTIDEQVEGMLSSTFSTFDSVHGGGGGGYPKGWCKRFKVLFELNVRQAAAARVERKKKCEELKKEMRRIKKELRALGELDASESVEQGSEEQGSELDDTETEDNEMEEDEDSMEDEDMEEESK